MHSLTHPPSTPQVKTDTPLVLTVESLAQHAVSQICFIVGQFSRLSPWKGQHILLKALAQCPKEIVVVFVGDDLFGGTEACHTTASAR